MQTADFRATYAQMSDEELLCLAADRHGLSEDAIRALDAELHHRGLHSGQSLKLKRNFERLRARDLVGTLGFTFRGLGRHFLGASNYTANLTARYEEFDSTLWRFIGFLPVFPVATVHIRRPLLGRSTFWSFRSPQRTLLELLPLDAAQVATTYAALLASAIVLFAIARSYFQPR